MSRSIKHEVPIDRVAPQVHDEKAAESYQNDELKRTVRSVIAALSESDQQVLTLHYMHGLTCREIGGYFGTSARAIEMRLYRARRQLKQEMLSTTQAEKSERAVFVRKKPEHRLKGSFTFDLLKSIQQEGITPHQPSTKPSWSAPLSMSLAGLTILCMVSLGIGTGDNQFSQDSDSFQNIRLIGGAIAQDDKTPPQVNADKLPTLGELVEEIRKHDEKIRNGMGYLIIKNQFIAPDRYFLRSIRIVFGKMTSYCGKVNRMSANSRFMMVRMTFCLSPIKA